MGRYKPRPVSIVAKRSPISATAELLLCDQAHNEMSRRMLHAVWLVSDWEDSESWCVTAASAARSNIARRVSRKNSAEDRCDRSSNVDTRLQCGLTIGADDACWRLDFSRSDLSRTHVKNERRSTASDVQGIVMTSCKCGVPWASPGLKVVLTLGRVEWLKATRAVDCGEGFPFLWFGPQKKTSPFVMANFSAFQWY